MTALICAAAIALGLLGWWAIAVVSLCLASVLVYLYLLLVAAVASIGGVNAALTWWMGRRRRL